MLSLRNYPKFLKIFNIILVCVGICYPFVIFLFPENKSILIVMIGICILRALSVTSWQRVSWIALSLVFLIYFLVGLKELAYLYPVFINLLFCIIFFLSLRSEAIITQIARKYEEIRGGILDSKAISYTRNLTKIWILFFIINGLISFCLIFLEDKIYWTIYCGVVSYILIGILFIVEFLYRKFILQV